MLTELSWIERLLGFLSAVGIFWGRALLRVSGSGKKHTNALVLNEFGECLGFGRIVGNMSGERANDEIAVRNVSDVGDFLRRER